MYSLCLVAIFWYLKNALIFRIIAVFWSRFLHRTTAMCCRNVLACFYAFLIFDPKWGFCQVYSLCLVAIFGYLKNALIFRIIAVFWSRFLLRTTAMCCRNVFSMFLCIFNFWPKWGFWQVYSLCLVAIFGNFQNALIFRILAVFWSRFLHRTTAMCCRNVFSMFLRIFNFWPKVRILPSV